MRLALLFLITLFAISTQAQTYRRLVNFEWEPIEEAKFYEIEIRKKGQTSKPNSFTTKAAAWNGRLQVGRYEFRLRAMDERKVPGDWSAYAELDVMLEPVKLKDPAPDSVVKAQGSEKQELQFNWQQTPAATGYIVEVYNQANEKVFEEKTSSTNFKYDLPTAANYTWKVKAISKDGLESESAEMRKFTLVGPKLEKPKIEKPEHEFVREVKWEAVDKAEGYDLVLAKYSPEQKKWQKFREFENYTQTSLPFEPDWTGGQYRLFVKSKASIREHSEQSVMTFPVRNGDRSPAAEYVHTMRKSIDRVNGWFAHGSWYASSISMNSQYRGVLGFNTNAVTGTGRMGIGWFNPEEAWGFIGIGEAGGYVFDNKIYNFLGLEFSAIRRQEISDRGEVRYHVGIFAKEFPALYTTAASAQITPTDPSDVEKSYGKGGVVGPHVGAEYWYSMTPKLGLQANAHLYFPMMGLEFPNGGKISSGADFNYSVGFLGSYRYSRKLTGLVGINYRQESYTYSDSSDAAGWNSGVLFGKSNSNVKTSIDGVYLNLMAEYSF